MRRQSKWEYFQAVYVRYRRATGGGSRGSWTSFVRTRDTTASTPCGY